jgi:hypothetical protein
MTCPDGPHAELAVLHAHVISQLLATHPTAPCVAVWASPPFRAPPTLDWHQLTVVIQADAIDDVTDAAADLTAEFATLHDDVPGPADLTWCIVDARPVIGTA